MSRRKVFDSDDEQELELLAPDKQFTNKSEESTDQENSENEEDNLVLESDSDSNPDEIGFNVSRQTTLAKVKDAIKQIEAEKQKVKQKRKQQDELFKMQKKKKIEALNKERLPEDFLQDLDSVGDKERENEHQNTQKDNTKQQDTETLQDRLQPSDEELSDEEDEEFIPLRSEPVEAVYVKEAIKKSKTSAESAADFRNKALFGPRIKREPVKAKMAKEIKRKARF